MCNLSWIPPSSLEKGNSLNHSCVKPKDRLFGVYITKYIEPFTNVQVSKREKSPLRKADDNIY